MTAPRRQVVAGVAQLGDQLHRCGALEHLLGPPCQRRGERRVERRAAPVRRPVHPGVDHRHARRACTLDHATAGGERRTLHGGIEQRRHRPQVADHTPLELHRDHGAAVGRGQGCGHGASVSVGQTGPMHRRMVLASSSRYRAAMLAEAGVEVEIDPPEHRRAGMGRPARTPRCGRTGARAGTPQGRCGAAEAPRRRRHRRRPGRDRATSTARSPCSPSSRTTRAPWASCSSMSGTTHELVNGLVLVDGASGRRAEGDRPPARHHASIHARTRPVSTSSASSPSTAPAPTGSRTRSGWRPSSPSSPRSAASTTAACSGCRCRCWVVCWRARGAARGVGHMFASC